MEEINSVKSGSKKNKIRPLVLVIGPIYPNGGGVGTLNNVLLNCSLIDQYEMLMLDTSRTKAGVGEEGKLALINIYYYFSQLVRLFWILIFRRPRLVHQSVSDRIAFFKEMSFIWVARLFGVKTVAHLHGNNLEVDINQAGPVRKWFMARAFSVPDCVIVLAKYWQHILQKQVSSSLNITIVPNCVDASIAAAMDRQIQRDEADCIVLSLGWVGKRKGVFDALRAASLIRAEYPSIRFIFAGGLEPGVSAEMIQQVASTNNIQDIVSFPGMVTGEDKIALLAKANVLILPSYHENLPISILEGMAMGLPVVATAIAGIPEIVQENINGYLIQPGNVQALADGILRLAKNPALRRMIGQANRERVYKEYHPDVFALRIASVYSRLLGRSEREENDRAVGE